MERERWESLYQILVRFEDASFRGIYSPVLIVAVYLWSVVHDRPTCWACQAKHWPSDLPVRRWLPSQSTMSRRLRRREAQALLAQVEETLRQTADEASCTVKIVDAKPLPVGGHSRDPEARWGYGVRGFLKGYKLFAIWGNGPLPPRWRVGAMNLSEARVAEQMMPELPGSGYLLGDSAFDINKLYDAASAADHQLLAPRKRPQAGLGHRPHSPARLRGLAILQTPTGQTLYRMRTAIERQFGGLTSFGGGSAPLPSWVRRLHRVQLWVQAKLIVNALRINNLAHVHADA